MIVEYAHFVLDAFPLQVGYSLRTHHLVEAQRALGLNAAVFVEPHANQLVRANKIFRNGLSVRTWDGVPYYRMTEPNMLRRWWILATQELRKRGIRGSYRFGKEFHRPADYWPGYIDSVVQHVSADLVHAHSPPPTARQGAKLAHRLKVPFVYEVRGFWDATAESEGNDLVCGVPLDEWRNQETEVARGANSVITLGEEMQRELVSRGVDPQRIHIIGNGVDTKAFARLQGKDVTLEASLGLEDRFVLGYVTNVRFLEGIEVVLDALPRILAQGIPVSFVLVGDGPDLPRLAARAEELGVLEHTHFVGRVEFRDVQKYYSLMDLFVVPRIDARVCRLVTPLKPLEAMALGIPVVVSDLPALTELAAPGVRGMPFRAEDPEDLERVVANLHANPSLRRQIADTAREWVEQERDWTILVKKTFNVYSEAREHHARVTGSTGKALPLT